MLPAESLPFREPDEAKPKGLYTCQVVSSPCSKRIRVMNLLWDGSYWRYPQGYRFKNTVCACYGPIPTLVLNDIASQDNNPKTTTDRPFPNNSQES